MRRVFSGVTLLRSKSLAILLVVLFAALGPAHPVAVLAAPPASCTDGVTGVPAGSAVLRGNYLCIGLSDKGTMGVGGSTEPGIRHSPSGNVTVDGNYDYLTPGSPYDGFALQADNINGGAFQSNVNGGTAAFTGSLTDTSAGSVNSATWTSTNHAAYDISNVYSFSDDDQTLKVSVTITAKTDIVNLRYLRSMDPDARAGAGDTSSTKNALGYGALPASDFVYTETIGTKVVLSMYSNSTVAHEAKLFASCCGITSPDTASIASGTGDWGIGIAFYVGDLANGSSVVLEYEYRFAASISDAAGGTAGVPNIDTARPGGYTIDEVNNGKVNSVFDGGTLALGSSGNIGAAFTVQSTNGTVNTGDNAVVFNGVFSGAGSISKTGTGTMTLTAANTNTGGFSVSGGTLKLASGASLTGGVTVNSGSRFVGNGTVTGTTTVSGAGSMLSGSGTFGDVVINNGATHQPGNSPGDVTVNGNYTINSGGNLELEVAADGTSDRLFVNGTVTLGGNLTVLGYGTNFTAASYVYTVIHNDAADAINSDFSRVTSDSAFYSLSYTLTGDSGNDMVLTLTRNTNTFQTLAKTPNQREVSRVLDGLPASTYASVLGLFNAQQVRSLLDSLSGEIYATSRTVLAENFARSLTANVTGQSTPFTIGCGFAAGDSTVSAAERANCVVANSFHFLAKGDYRTYDAGDSAAASSSIGGIEGKILFPFELDGGKSHAFMGVIFAHEGGSVQTPSLNSSAITDANGASVVAGWAQGGLDVTGALGFNLASVRADRQAGGVDTRGRFDVNSLGASLGVSYAVQTDAGIAIRSFGALTYALTSNSAFTETTSGSLGYSGREGSTDQAWATLGLSLSSQFVLEDAIVRPRAEIALNQRIAGAPGSMSGSIAGADPFTTQGTGSGDTTVKLGVGATMLTSSSVTLDADYRIEASGASFAHSATASMKVSF